MNSLDNLTGWEHTEQTIHKDFEFENFSQALNFVNKVGDLAEQANHHPDILLHDYKKVEIKLTTHDKGRVTDKDTSLARKIDGI